MRLLEFLMWSQNELSTVAGISVNFIVTFRE